MCSAVLPENFERHLWLSPRPLCRYVISGFIRGVRSPLFWNVTQSRLVASYRRFGTIFRSHLQGLNSPTSGTNYQSTLRNVQKTANKFCRSSGTWRRVVWLICDELALLTADESTRLGWWWRQRILSPNRRDTSTRLHGVKTRKNTVWILNSLCPCPWLCSIMTLTQT
jgi:hypothetical protein